MNSTEQSEPSLNQKIAEFNRSVFAYEDQRVEDLNHLITLLESFQDSLHAPQSAALLQDSLEYIMDAETQEELSVYRESFLAALKTTKLKGVLDLDDCINALRTSADDLFYWSDLESDPKMKQLGGKNILDDSLREADEAIQKFKREALILEKEFNQQIIKNNSEIAAITKVMNDNASQANENYLSQQENLAALKEQNLKFSAGLKRITTQKFQLDRALEIIQKVPQSTSKEERQQLRADFAIALHELRLIDKRTGYNHFVNKCKTNVEELCAARSSYLRRDDSLLHPLSKVALTVGKMALPPLHHLPEEFPSFAYDSLQTSGEFALGKHSQLGKRQTPPQPSNKTVNIIKKAASLLLGAGSLVLSGLLCLTVIGIPKGVALAATGLGMMNSVKEGSDFFTENYQQIKRNKMITQRLESLEQKHDALHQHTHELQKSLKPSKTQASKKLHTSETKIDLLLMGHKPQDILSEDEINKLHQTQTVVIPDETPTTSSNKISELVPNKEANKSLSKAENNRDDEGETDTDSTPKPH